VAENSRERWGEGGMENRQHALKAAAIVLLASAAFAAGEGRKDLRYIVGPHAAVSVTNEYGPISVKPGAPNQVLVTAVTHSGKVEIDQTQSGNRIDVLSHLLAGADSETGRVDYEVQVPADASLILRSSTGALHAERLHGDVTLEGATGNVDVREVSDAHVHIKTLKGPITLTNIHDGHVEVTSVSGEVVMDSVSGPLVQVNSTSGKIFYDGDFGSGGEYRLASHTGDIEATAPDDASIEVIAHSVKGKVENDFRLQPKHTPFTIKAGSAFAGTMNKAASSVRLFSFSGKIHLKKR
jgi:DUF4097 and DUF4098 domain-containing protein YvlB